MKHLDLFSGIGLFALAASWAGIETVAFCECEPFAVKVLSKNFPGVPVYPDVREMCGREILRRFGPVDIISGGIPCQPASCAGKREGTADDRWLWPEAFRVVSEIKPTWCLFENVSGLLTLDGGMVFQNLLSELESLGYEVQAFVIPACAVDAPHRRDRVWILAHAESGRTLREPGNVCQADGRPGRALQRKPDGASDVAHAHGKGYAQRSRETGERTHAATGRSNRRPTQPGVRRVDDGRSARLDGYWPELPADIAPTGYKIPNRAARLKCLGNGIVPQVAYQIFKAMLEAST